MPHYPAAWVVDTWKPIEGCSFTGSPAALAGNSAFRFCLLTQWHITQPCQAVSRFQRLQTTSAHTPIPTVDLSQTCIIEILGSTFAYCSQLQQLSLPRNSRIIEQEAFLKCTSLQEVCIPPSLLYIARRAFAGCTQLRAVRKKGKSKTWRGTCSMHLTNVSN